MSNPQIELAARTFVARLPPVWPHGGVDAPMAGWSESSWDLASGLVVLEGLPLDAGLGEWLGAACVSVRA